MCSKATAEGCKTWIAPAWRCAQEPAFLHMQRAEEGAQQEARSVQRLGSWEEAHAPPPPPPPPPAPAAPPPAPAKGGKAAKAK